jgi:predicted transposase YbfD/YdcC
MEMREYFANVETTEEHNGYYYNVGETLTIVILGSFCGLNNASQIHQWAVNQRVAEFLREQFKIEKIPCYYWLLCLLKMIKPASLNQHFTNWVESLLSDGVKNLTVSFDGKTIRSTGKMKKYEKALQIVSAHIAELGITFGQQATNDKSNEIPAVRELIAMLDLEGCIVVADAINCQKDTAKAIIKSEADYILSVKDNHEILKKDIEDYVQDDDLRKTMDTFSSVEKQSGRIEKRTAFASCDIDWLDGKTEWNGMACIGAINTVFTTQKGTTNEWHYFISSRKLTAEELLKRVRLEWTVETMHWFLDVHFAEDFCRIEEKNVQQNLNIVRKIVLNCIKLFKRNTESKRPVSKIMLDCLLEPTSMLAVLENTRN